MVCIRWEKPIYAPPRLQRYLWNGSNVRLTDDGPLLSFQSSASSFHTSLLLVIDGVVSLVLCLQIVSQAPQHSNITPHGNTVPQSTNRLVISDLTSAVQRALLLEVAFEVAQNVAGFPSSGRDYTGCTIDTQDDHCPSIVGIYFVSHSEDATFIKMQIIADSHSFVVSATIVSHTNIA